MTSSRLNLVVVMALMLASVQFHGAAAQTTHVVGDTFGWNVPASGPSAYTTWASGQTFRVGDILLFNFISGFHDVAEVSQAAYDPCTTTNPISSVTTGPARLTLNAPGTHYYICTFGSHCHIGQKLTINVTATSSTPPPTSSQSPSGSNTPSPTYSTTLPPPSPSFAPSFTVVAPYTLLAMAVAFFY